MSCFWPKYIMFQLKTYRRVMFDCTQDWYKVWRKTGMCFQKLKWGIWQIFTRAFRSLQIGTLIVSFCLKLKMYELKNYRGVMCHDMQKLKKNWLVSSKLTWGIWQILTQALENIKKVYFNRLLLTNVNNVWAKNSIEELFLIELNDLCFQKWHEEFSKFSPEYVWKPKNWNFNGVLLSKVQNLWA